MKTKNLSSKNKAFTLVEMLVVIAVIAVLVAIAIPALSNSKSDSQQKSAEARAKVLNEARDRAILKNLVARGTNTSERAAWDNMWGTNATDAAAFLISNNLVRVKDLQ